MDRLQAMRIFTRVVEANSFNKAAEKLSLSRSSVTTIVKNLEAFLGVRLLYRTTRRLNLTVDGAAYYERCQRILADIEETEARFHSAAAQPRGKLRVDMTGAIGRLVVFPNLGEFQKRFPDVDLSIRLSDRIVDLIQEGIDCAIRVGELEDSSLVARRIGSFKWTVCAAPEFIERYGEPKRIEDLSDYRSVGYISCQTGRAKSWEFIVDGETRYIKVPSTLTVNDIDAYVTCGLKGLGLIRPPYCVAQPYLESGQLRELLQTSKAPLAPISIVYPQNRQVSSAVRAFVDWAAELFAEHPLLMRGR
jgi:LysR family transcriptional regulator, regulator for bpeEF and oprC